MVKYPHHFRDLEKNALLKSLAEFRASCIKASSETLFDNKPVHGKLQNFLKSIDELAGDLTGNVEYFHSQPLSNTRFMPANKK